MYTQQKLHILIFKVGTTENDSHDCITSMKYKIPKNIKWSFANDWAIQDFTDGKFHELFICSHIM